MSTEMDSPKPFMPLPEPKALPLTAEAEELQRKAVVTEALKWVNTPYHQQADILGAGIDCSMLLVRAWVDAGVFKPFDPRPYPPNWHLHHSEERYLHWMEALAVEVETPRAGDIALFQFGRCFSHGGIMITPTQVVNASVLHGTTCISDMHEPWLVYFDKRGTRKRPTKFFDVWAAIHRQYPADPGTHQNSLAEVPR
jgi:cell wall-associated NlpC family hydrolase